MRHRWLHVVKALPPLITEVRVDDLKPKYMIRKDNITIENHRLYRAATDLP